MEEKFTKRCIFPQKACQLGENLNTCPFEKNSGKALTSDDPETLPKTPHDSTQIATNS
jgi:hypothetical protein